MALDRAGVSPGEIDGVAGANTERALLRFKAARGLSPDHGLTAEVVRALGRWYHEPLTAYTIADREVTGPFSARIPDDLMAQAELPMLEYGSPLERLGERFHSDPALLRGLNPDAGFAAGESIQVPNVEPFEPSSREGLRRMRPPAADRRVLVSAAQHALSVTEEPGRVVFYAPVTVGGVNDPLPVGRFLVTAVLDRPKFHYNPDLFWDADPLHAKATLPPGPNNPVGLVWIDLDNPHMGIHGTPAPERVGHDESHGCIRLTNWDALRLADLVGKGTPVELQ